MRGAGFVTGCLGLGLLITPVEAAAAPECKLKPGYRSQVGEPWPQRRLGFDRVWPLTRGQGQLVAVIDSGAALEHPMLAGKVARFEDLTKTGPRDCTGHGTAIAALLAGARSDDRQVPLSGVAPGARLLIVKHQNEERDATGGDRLPKAIRLAVDRGARVINISIKAGPSPELAQAVQYALSRDRVIVAAAGNAEKEDGEQSPAYPASYPGVISVASLGPDGRRADSSSLQSKVDVGAPGKGIPTAWAGGDFAQVEGTSYAAAFVSGTAALVRSHHPHLTQAQVARRIIATAEGNAGDATGRGMINPLQAVSAVIPQERAVGTGTRQPAEPAKLAVAPPPDDRTRKIGFGVAGGALAAAVLAALVGIVLPMGRRRGWRPGLVNLAFQQPEDEPVASGTERGTIGPRD